MQLVARLQAAQDAYAVRHVRLRRQDLLEAPLQRRVLLDVLPVLVQGRGAHTAQLPTRQQGLQEVSSVHRTAAGARPHDGVYLIDERNDLPIRRLDFGQHGLEALLEIASVLGAGHHAADVERDDLLVLERLRHVLLDDSAREALDDRRLADAGLADDHRIVLGTPRQDLDNAPDFVVAANDRVQLPVPSHLREVGAIGRERLISRLGRLRRHRLLAADSVHGLDERVSLDAELQQAPLTTPRVPAEGEQQVLGGDVFVAHLLG
mmetsp:Transcript_75078/g.208782  ORF Transcript_75078/g.208782 Transcript_75078/m.208782 type:complete len:264 (-) Transcript_75078:400-1191(-)